MLETLENDLAIYIKMMGEAVDIIMTQDVSNYPIMVVYSQEVEIGIPLVPLHDTAGPYGINASSLEELVVKQVVSNEKIADFRKNYKSPEKYLCLLLLTEFGANFVFMQRK